MSEEAKRLIAEVAREVECASSLAIALRNIAGGHWNAGREPGTDLTVHEYARQTLRACRLPEEWS